MGGNRLVAPVSHVLQGPHHPQQPIGCDAINLSHAASSGRRKSIGTVSKLSVPKLEKCSTKQIEPTVSLEVRLALPRGSRDSYGLRTALHSAALFRA